MPQLDHRPNQRGVLRALVDRREEGPVDLDLGDRELLEAGQRGLAAAEVIDRQTDAELRQRLQARRGAAIIR
jgi:hypothetical protein